MQVNELRNKVSHLKTKKQMFINETYMWVNLARKSVSCLSDDSFEFDVPKAKFPEKMKSISRSNPKELKQRIISKDIYNSAFVSLVASIEDYLFKISEWILLYDNNRIKFSLQGVSSCNTISVIDLIDYNKEDLIKKIINDKLINVFYASPQKQIEYFEKALDIKIDKDIWETWIEIKARRDILVHNNGIINELYLIKTGNNNSSLIGLEITLSDKYFTDSVAFFKRMTGQINKKLREYFK